MKKYIFNCEFDKPQYNNKLYFSIVGAADEKVEELQNTIEHFLNKNKYFRSGKKTGKIFDILGQKIGEYKITTNIF